MRRASLRGLPLLLLSLFLLAACTTASYRASGPEAGAVRPGGVLAGSVLDRDLEDRILALDPENVGDADVRGVLAKGPVPQLMLLHGGIYPVHLAMESFARFLLRMGYPEARIRHPGDGRWSHSPYEDSSALAGLAAWYYEKEGTRVMLIGHSQGGMQAVKALDELEGVFAPSVAVWNPFTDSAEERDWIVDPLTGMRRPVVGLSVAYASAVGSGGAAFLLPNQWSMVSRLRNVPDSVDEFTGFTIGVDLVAWSFEGDPSSEYRASGHATVRNMILPAAYNHVVVPVTAHLAESATMRAWINAYRPGRYRLPEGDTQNLLWAADVWYSVKKHWVIEAQRFVLARRALAPSSARSGG